MRKISEKKALELINNGQVVKCKIGRDCFVPVKSVQDLQKLKFSAKSGVHSFELYLVPKVSLPKDTYALSIESAIFELDSKESIYAFVHGKEKTITSFSELMNVCRTCEIWGDEIVLYKYKYRK